MWEWEHSGHGEEPMLTEVEKEGWGQCDEVREVYTEVGKADCE